MQQVAIVIIDEKQQLASETLASRLSLPVVRDDQRDAYSFLLFFEAGILKILNYSPDNSANNSTGPVWVDFSQGKSAYRHKHQGKGKLPISRACGIKHNHRPTIIDATAGLGKDAFVLAGLGCFVLCIEQQPILAALLADGLARAKKSAPWLKAIVKDMQLVQDKAETALLTRMAEVIYLDPMYPHDQNRKQAKVNKGMQLFRVFPGTESDECALLKAALQATTDRVVVKRPVWASPLAEQQPTYQVPATNHRFDVYKIDADK